MLHAFHQIYLEKKLEMQKKVSHEIVQDIAGKNDNENEWERTTERKRGKGREKEGEWER